MKSQVSALMDGALDEGSLSSVLNALSRDAQLRQTWSDYHLIGEALRQSPQLSSDMTPRVMERLAGEPTVLAPHDAIAPRHRVLRYALPLAASVMGIGVVAWVAQTLNAPPQTPNIAAVQPQALGSGSPARRAQAAPPSEEAVIAKASQVQPYLFAHQGYSPVNNIQGVAPYVRIVSDARQGAAR